MAALTIIKNLSAPKLAIIFDLIKKVIINNLLILIEPCEKAGLGELNKVDEPLLNNFAGMTVYNFNQINSFIF